MARYWKSLNNNSNKQKKSKSFPKATSRRDFLKMFGFGMASTFVLSRCKNAAHKAIPFLIKPEEITPSKANYYASSFFDGDKFNSIVAKVLDGRPIKLEGNELSPITNGGINCIAQASILSLYDDTRYRNPIIDNENVSFSEIDKQIIEKLNQIKSEKGKIALISSTIISPTTQKVIDRFVKKYPSCEHIIYDPISVSGLLEANHKLFGVRTIPKYYFNKAKLIIGINADFLGTWLSPVEYTKEYITNRKVSETNRDMSRHIQIESGMSLTGSNADKRIVINPSDEQKIVTNLYNYIAVKLNKETIDVASCNVDIAEIGEELLQNKQQSLLVCGTNNVKTQLIVNGINQLLENYGTTISFKKRLRTKQGNDRLFKQFVDNLQLYKAVIFYDCNPCYNSLFADKLCDKIKNIDTSISLASVPDETSILTKYVCPSNNYLESWDDFIPQTGIYSLSQPCILPIFNTRQAQSSLLKWISSSDQYSELVKETCKKEIYPKTDKLLVFEDFWTLSLQKGIVEFTDKFVNPRFKYDLSSISIAETKELKPELQIYESVNIGSGKYANNPWLQELPDPITKVTWDNYASISQKLAKKYDLQTGDVIRINQLIEIPVWIQAGQASNTISIALGYGRKVSGKSGKNIGVNIYPLLTHTHISIEKTLHNISFATTQQHSSMEGRDIIRETTLSQYQKKTSAGNERHKEIEKHHQSLYNKYKYEGHHWAMAIDLNACIGCNACVISCNIENNIPVVGKEEVQNAHEMHWLRIDRYYKGNSDNPRVVRQPVMCQHCDNAPCENVCPVGASNHSSEGINQMAYNRCIGTRYCNNNCPYKVRRFNWFDYNNSDALSGNLYDPNQMTNDLPRMVLNPDVTVRAKGVIEKCSFCVQRIQEKKLQAKLENRTLRDGEIQTACEQVCPANAIVFGDLNDKNSRVYKLFKEKRRYHLLEELHTLPSIGYLTKVNNV